MICIRWFDDNLILYKRKILECIDNVFENLSFDEDKTRWYFCLEENMDIDLNDSLFALKYTSDSGILLPKDIDETKFDKKDNLFLIFLDYDWNNPEKEKSNITKKNPLCVSSICKYYKNSLKLAKVIYVFYSTSLESDKIRMMCDKVKLDCQLDFVTCTRIPKDTYDDINESLFSIFKIIEKYRWEV